MVSVGMPKRRVIMTAKERALIALTIKTLEDSPAEIGKEIGAPSEQVSRDVYKDLINEELVEKREDGKLTLTKKGQSEPLVGIMLEMRDIGKKLMLLGALLAITVLIGITKSIIKINLSNIVDQEYVVTTTGFIFVMFFIGAYLYDTPRRLLSRVKKELTNVSRDRSSDT